MFYSYFFGGRGRKKLISWGLQYHQTCLMIVARSRREITAKVDISGKERSCVSLASANLVYCWKKLELFNSNMANTSKTKNVISDVISEYYQTCLMIVARSRKEITAKVDISGKEQS